MVYYENCLHLRNCSKLKVCVLSFIFKVQHLLLY
uniref:Uncharacterized protein n=1 Tax=Ciona intestinalis TaxID=7719 RepID=H2XZ10_CIOIN